MNNLGNYSVHVLFDGYSYSNSTNVQKANCTCTLIKGPENIIVDTMTSWDGERIIQALSRHNISPESISYVISTHGHSDHIGNNNLFLNTKLHIIGFSISHRDEYYIHPFENGTPYKINENIEVIPTPGHTLSDVTIIVKTLNGAVCAIAGDLFESEHDINNPNLWLEAGSESPDTQRQNRLLVAEMSDWIIPGHGRMFQSTHEIREKLRAQIKA